MTNTRKALNGLALSLTTIGSISSNQDATCFCSLDFKGAAFINSCSLESFRAKSGEKSDRRNLRFFFCLKRRAFCFHGNTAMFLMFSSAHCFLSLQMQFQTLSGRSTIYKSTIILLVSTCSEEPHEVTGEMVSVVTGRQTAALHTSCPGN